MQGIIIDTNKQYVKLICEKGEIIIDINGKYLKNKDGKGVIRKIKIKEGSSGRCTAIAELRDKINKNKPTSLTSDDILQEQKILLALGLAGITGKMVKLSEIKDDFTITGKFDSLYP